MEVDGGIALCQTKYIQTLLCRFGLEVYKPFATTIETNLKPSHDPRDYVDVTLYQKAVGWLIYACIMRPKIKFLVS